MSERLPKSFLERIYTQQGLSTWAIEKKYGLARSRVYSALKKYNIPTRSLAASHVRYVRTDFSGDLCEKAYLIGFAIGDLRVRRHNGLRSETISIGCGSTKVAQIQLIENLFKRYGRVWKGKPDKRGAINIEAFVNKSFEFLLPDICDYAWCAKRRQLFFAFVAGFTDAEGSMSIANGKAFISWGNYNTKILHFIKDTLLRYGVSLRPICCDKLKGYIGVHGYVRNANYCHLACHRKEDIAMLLKEIAPYIRHADKKEALVRLQKNLIMRGLT